MTKECNVCNLVKPVTDFHVNGRGGYKPHCKPCRSLIRKAHSNGRVGKEAARKAHLQARYGLTIEQWQDMYDEQAGKCAICKENLLSPHTDHCHTTGKVRGILCPLCNKGLGHFRDNSKYLESAIKYLEE